MATPACVVGYQGKPGPFVPRTPSGQEDKLRSHPWGRESQEGAVWCLSGSLGLSGFCSVSRFLAWVGCSPDPFHQCSTVSSLWTQYPAGKIMPKNVEMSGKLLPSVCRAEGTTSAATPGLPAVPSLSNFSLSPFSLPNLCRASCRGYPEGPHDLKG
ncbi:hypothetical protein P7K49_002216 [Saguinus oedipus]|uniref:Uncharacterized protein n=1 Tax=Saguinus oedipus TaxID=9490 RepID=A0ABQ9WGP2_SAGOE|nr:hypothetical protein P7K49_002216 [Saguinus oedipus]